MLKKAQLSIFIIISVVIIFVAAFLFFNDSVNLFYSPENQLAGELREEVNTCVVSSAQLGVFLLGFQGGYISIPQEIENDPTKRLVFNSNGSLNSGALTIPNWDSERGGIPTRDSMESDLEEFISQDSQSCIESNLESYTSYLNLNYTFDNYQVEASINDQNVEIESELPIEFSEKSGDIDSQLSSYYSNLEDTSLGDLHSLAVEIYNVERESQLFEELVMDQIYSSGERSSQETSMPTEGITFSCTPQIWTKTQLKETLAELNNNNFNYLYFEGTRSIDNRFETNLDEDLEDLRQYYKTNYVHSLPSEKSSFENFEVDVMMPTSEFTGSTGYFNNYPYRTFEITPSSGEVVEAMDLEIDMGANLPIPCMQIFHHLYTLDYDLMVRLQDYTSQGEEDLLFQFPLRIQIEENSPKEASQNPIETQEPNTATSQQFCAQDNRNTNTQIYVQDDTTNEYLSNANVTYTCLGLTCDIGSTRKQTYGPSDIVRPNSIPLINTSLGYCVGGKIEVEKEGYFQIGQNPQRINTAGNQKINPITALMVPTKEFDVNPTTLTATSYESCNSFSRDNGQFYINIENEGYDFESTAFYPTPSTGYMDSLTLLEKPETPYNITIIYTRGEEPYGMLEFENKVLDYDSGNRIQIDIPTSQVPLKEGNAVRYFEEIDSIMENEYTCPGISYGMRVR